MRNKLFSNVFTLVAGMPMLVLPVHNMYAQPAASFDGEEFQSILNNELTQPGTLESYGGVSRKQFVLEPTPQSGPSDLLQCNYATGTAQFLCETDAGSARQYSLEELTSTLADPEAFGSTGSHYKGLDIFVTDQVQGLESSGKFLESMDDDWLKSSRCVRVCVVDEATGELVCETIC